MTRETGDELRATLYVPRTQYGERRRLALHDARSLQNPAVELGRIISDALDPVKASGKVKSFADMTEEERDEMRRKYEKPGKP